MASKQYIGFDPTTGAAFKFDAKMARKRQETVTSAELALIRSALGVPGSAEGLTPSNNLSDVASVATARANLDVYNRALIADKTGALVPANALSFDGNDYVDLTDLALLEPGAGETIAIFFTFYFPGAGSIMPLFDKRASGSLGYLTRINASGKLGAYLQDSGGSISSTDDGAVLTAGWHRAGVVITRGAGGTIARYVDTSDIYGTEDGISGITGSLAVAQTARIGNDDSSQFFTGMIADVVVLNTAPTTEAIARYMATGVFPPEYQQAQTAYTGDFSAGIDGMANFNLTLTGNIDAIGGVDNTLRGVATSTNSGFAYVFGSADLPKGTLWRAKGRFYMPSGNTTAEELELTFGSGNSVILNTDHSSDAWVEFDTTFAAPTAGREIRLWFATAAGDRFGGTSGDTAYLVDFEFGPVGEIWNGDFEAIDTVNGVLPDRTGFGNNGTITGAKTVRKSRGLHIEAETPAAGEKLVTVKAAGTEVASINKDGDAVLNKLNVSNLPTSSAGLSSGDVWNDSGTLKIIT